MEYSTTFNQFFTYLMQVEGIESDDPVDRGGHTRFGISKRSYPQLDIASLTLDQAKAIYHRDYWLAGQCPQMPAVLAFCTADGMVNHGRRMGIKILQRTLGAKEDGTIGPATLAKANKIKTTKATEEFIALYSTIRLAVYQRIIQKRPEQKKFNKGWQSRVEQLAAACQRVCVVDPPKKRTFPMHRNTPVALSGLCTFFITFFMVLSEQLGDLPVGATIPLADLLRAASAALPAAMATSWAHKSKSPDDAEVPKQ